MAKKTVGDLIKEARTGAGMTQEQLARKIKGVSANDISLAERGQIELTQAVLKEIAKATGVTQSSLLEAAKSGAKKTTSSSSKKTSSSSTAKKTSSSGTAKKTTSSSSQSSMKVTATEKKLVELYRKADADDKKKVMSILKGEDTDVLGDLLGNAMGIIGKLGNGK